MEFCGVLEGFYGPPWTLSQRQELISSWLAPSPLDSFMYAPKDDVKHRARWRDRYDDSEINALSQLIECCNSSGIKFIYAIAPGLTVSYSDDEDFRSLCRKLQQLVEVHCSHFALLFDDIPSDMHVEDEAKFVSLADAQSSFVNRVCEYLHRVVPGGRVLFCPTEYCDELKKKKKNSLLNNNDYLTTIGSCLRPEVIVLMTGPSVITGTLTVSWLEQTNRLLQRKVAIWDNLFANDYDQRSLFLGPFHGRSAEIQGLISGLLLNPNCEFELNFVPIRTLSHWAASPVAYSPKDALQESIMAWSRRIDCPELTLEELQTIIHFYYLPFENGTDAVQYLEAFSHAATTPSNLWNNKLLRDLDDISSRFLQGCDKVANAGCRPFLYAFYPYMVDMMNEMKMQVAYVQVKRNSTLFASAPFQPPQLSGTFRRGILPQLQSLYSVSSQGLWQTAVLANRFLSPFPFLLRLCEDKDRLTVYQLWEERMTHSGCHLRGLPPTVQSGMEQCRPYLDHFPQHSFVLVDGEGICGYCLGCLDVRRWVSAPYTETSTPLAGLAPFLEKAAASDSYGTYGLYPACMDLYLTPRVRGQHWTKSILRDFTHRLQQAAVRGVYITVLPKETVGKQCLQQAGFHVIDQGIGDKSDLTFWGRQLA
jgi:hypothetical protein